MLLQIKFPDIKPVLFEIGPISVRWYGLMYMASFIIGYFLLKRAAKRRKLDLSTDDLYDLLFLLILGVMVGGRLGYVLFYDFSAYVKDPISILKIWKGGMSFHGGFIGVVLAAMYYAKKKKRSFWEIADLVCVAAPIGLGLGRIGNFINGELYGRPTTLPWGMIFPDPLAGSTPRHPSQLYEAILEGLVLFIILRWLYNRNYRSGVVFWGLVGFYGLMRFLVEFVRQPDQHIGLDLGPLTRGQLLSLPMMVIGLVMMARLMRQPVEQSPGRLKRVKA
jgi:phosphatidylglycerol:prolipoprotein diacylglycerol transferase